MKTDELETLVRDALGDHADRAHEPADTIAAVLAPSRRRPVVAYVAAAVVALLLLVVAPIMLKDKNQGTLLTGSMPMLAPAPLTVPARTGPTWLPDGLVEVDRITTPNGQVLRRTWARTVPYRPYADAGVSVTIARTGNADWWMDPCYDKSEPVDVNGLPGTLHSAGPGPRESCLLFDLDVVTHVRVAVTNVPDEKAVALRIARSISPVSSPPLVVAAEFGPLPAEFDTVLLSVAKTPNGVSTQLTAAPEAGGDSVTVEWTDERVDPERTNGYPVTVRGRRATFYPMSQTSGDQLWTDFGDKRLLVEYRGSTQLRPEREVWVMGIAESVSIGSDPNDWIGQR
ncbi:hypothetical protein [Actinokineospora globicatena]|uniref:hypothetical protein n=1 Tax=Actinokineospora globicatena TaxID=103729 RepID=UPI0020A49D35|nr:hypothetical protein [Actinokineospora globicatena]MCP2302168.1 hypothetical protein [Actinokineospora globicatena]GLW76171.1 hypothetical protein Aglo01_06530 [Actinokineospora globicatena]GLW83007.1 hypothetical protein Aglo02_06470 [Actinokineospora globicatena]